MSDNAKAETVDMTPSQLRAMKAAGHGVLVSAAAGSGKTATLAERVAYLVCSAEGEAGGGGGGGGCSVEQVLVLTFTENAAAEMRTRIDRKLRQRAEKCVGDAAQAHARRQVLLAGRATVGTIHSFCARLIRQHFQRLDLDPRFGILPAEEAKLLEAETLRAVLDAAHTGPHAGHLRDLAEWYGNGDDAAVATLVARLHQLSASVLDPADWRSRAVQRLEQAAESPKDSALGLEFEFETARRVEELARRAEVATRLVESDFPGYAAYIAEHVVPWVELWQEELERDGHGAWALTAPPEKLPNLPTIKGEPPGKKQASDTVNALKKEIVTGPHPGELPADEAFWKRSLAATLPHVREMLRLAEDYEHAYRDAKDARRVLDFADLERFALRLLSDGAGGPSDVARMLHGHYRHVLVDECQDINAVQNEILRLVSTECACGPAGSNLFSVGDIKQSIYRFRLAEPRLFSARETAYATKAPGGKAPPGEIVRLAENFRSRGRLLEVVNAVFSRLMVGGRTEIDYADGHALRAGRTYPDGTFPGSPAELHLIPAPDRAAGAAAEPATPPTDPATPGDEQETEDLSAIEREAEFIARRIRELMGLAPPTGSGAAFPRATVYDKELAAVRPIRYADIAVLLRVARGKAKLTAAMLRRRGIPVFADVRGGLMESQEVRDVLSLLELLDNPDRDLPLAAYLRSPLSLLAAPEETMARARVAFPSVPFHQAISLYAAGTDNAGGHAAGLADALGRLSAARELARRRNIADVLEDVYERTFFTAYASGLVDGAQRQANLLELLEYARRFSADEGSDVAGFTGFLKAIEDSDNDLDQPAIVPGGIGGGGDVVTVQTIHKSKGLEYAVVFLPDLANDFNLRDLGGSVMIDRDTLLSPKAPDPAKNCLYPTPAWLLARARRRPLLVAEELRVLYVAMTRAREHLILVASADAASLDRARALYGASGDPVPESDVVAAARPLDWVLWAHASAAAAGEHAFDVFCHDPAEVTAWTEAAQRYDATPIPDHVLRLEPPPTPASDLPAARAVTDLLGWRYPHAHAAARRASVSVTALTHGPLTPPTHPSDPDRIPPDHTPPPEPLSLTAPPDPLAPYFRELPLSRTLAEQTVEIAPTDRGTATHLAFEHLDFRGDLTSAGLQAQLQSMVDRHLLTPREAAAVSTTALQFAAHHPTIGPLLRGDLGPVHLELPVYLPHTPDGEPETLNDPFDCQMVRGRIDALIDTPEGPVVIDYKTDHVWSDRLRDRITQYAKQVAFYRTAAEAITGRPCAAVYLVFVDDRARHVERL